MIEEYDTKWMNTEVKKVPGKQGKYRLMCAMLLKKYLTYSNLFMLTYALHKNKYKDNEIVLKEKILKDLAYIYYYNENKLPDGFTLTKN
jgi:hypothetical protein